MVDWVYWFEKGLVCLAIVTLLYVLYQKWSQRQSHLPLSMQILGSLPLGKKEKIVICDCGNKQLVLGVTQHQISLLHAQEKESKTALNQDSHSQSESTYYNPYFT